MAEVSTSKSSNLVWLQSHHKSRANLKDWTLQEADSQLLN